MKELFSNIKENFNSGLETLQHIFEFYQSIKNNTDLSEIEKQASLQKYFKELYLNDCILLDKTYSAIYYFSIISDSLIEASANGSILSTIENLETKLPSNLI